MLLDVMLFPFQGPLYIQSFVKNDAKNYNRGKIVIQGTINGQNSEIQEG